MMEFPILFLPVTIIRRDPAETDKSVLAEIFAFFRNLEPCWRSIISPLSLFSKTSTRAMSLETFWNEYLLEFNTFNTLMMFWDSRKNCLCEISRKWLFLGKSNSRVNPSASKKFGRTLGGWMGWKLGKIKKFLKKF